MSSFNTIFISNDFAKNNTEKAELAKLFHMNTKHSNKLIFNNMCRSRRLVNNPTFRNLTSLPEKIYLNSRREYLNEISSVDGLEKILTERKSQVKEAINYKLTKKEISNLCWAAYGQNIKNTRTVPSGGALYPCELYLISLNSDLGRGIYHYRPSLNCLESISNDIPNLDQYLMMTKGFENTSIIFLISGILERISFKYGDRGYRYMLFEAGAISQNISLMSTNLNLVSTWFGGTADIVIEKMLNIDGINESLINCVLINKESY
ncbi:MAG: SagB family peptide dehydrogenase [Sarcina sp.]